MNCLGHLLVDATLLAFPYPRDQSLIWVINKQKSHAGCDSDYAVGNFGNLVIWLVVELPL